jgi:hypothetical protein
VTLIYFSSKAAAESMGRMRPINISTLVQLPVLPLEIIVNTDATTTFATESKKKTEM